MSDGSRFRFARGAPGATSCSGECCKDLIFSCRQCEPGDRSIQQSERILYPVGLLEMTSPNPSALPRPKAFGSDSPTQNTLSQRRRKLLDSAY
jgi:hypothetical protein